MTNFERNKDRIIEIMQTTGCSIGVSKTTNEMNSCDKINCYDCQFFMITKPCAESRLEWFNEKVKPINWDIVPVDTPIQCSMDGGKWHNRYLAKVDDGRVYAFNDGRTSFTMHNNVDYTRWKYVRLFRQEDIERFSK